MNTTSTRFRAWELVPLVVAAVVLVAVGIHALTEVSSGDFEGYFSGAQKAWLTGYPWPEAAWVGTPALALVLAPFTALKLTQAAWTITVLNMFVAAGLLTAAHVWIRKRTAPWFAWVITLALTGSAVLATNLWWKQLNLIAVAIGVLGFVLLRRYPVAAGVLIGLSIGLKPLLIVLPVFLLARAATRRSGIAAVVAAFAANVVGLAVLKAHGGSGDPLLYYRRFNARFEPSALGSTTCRKVNTSPTGVGCQLFGADHISLIRASSVVLLIVVVIAVVVWLRGAKPTSLVVLAWAALLSPMFGTVQWPHYGICLAPMVLWIAAVAYREPRRWWLWAGLVTSWVLLSMLWAPAMSLPAQVRSWFGGSPESHSELITWYRAAAIAQIVLAITAISAGSRLQSRRHGPERQPVSTDSGAAI